MLPPALPSLPPSFGSFAFARAKFVGSRIRRTHTLTWRVIRECARSKPLYYTFSLRLINNSRVAMPPPPPLLPPTTTMTSHAGKEREKKESNYFYPGSFGVWVNGDVQPAKGTETRMERTGRRRTRSRRRGSRGVIIRANFLFDRACALDVV